MIKLFFLIAAAALFSAPVSGLAETGTKVVHFESAVLSSGNAKSEAQKSGTPIWGHLDQPRKAGSHPTVILMHGCGGIKQSHMEWARLLNDAGYVTLIVDSYRPRSLIQQCGGAEGSASSNGRILDA